MTRNEHLQWCKNRVLEYVDANEMEQALASMCSDLNKHPETAGHIGCQFGMIQMISGGLKKQNEMRNFIEGFN